MSMNREYSVPEILELACREYNKGRPVDEQSKRQAIEKRVRRYLKEQLGMRGPYRVEAQQARDIVKIHLSDYFAKQFYEKDEADQYRKIREQAREALAAQRSYLDNVEGERDTELEVLEQLRYEETHGQDYALPESELDRVMLRALFYRVFADFDEAQFRLDYAEKGKINDLLRESADPDDQRDIHESIRHQELSEKLNPAFRYGKLDRYLHDARNRDVEGLK